MEIIKFDENAVKKAVKTLKDDGTIIYPTDTIYGLGVNATKKRTVKKVFDIKRRSYNKPISIAVTEEMIGKLFEINQVEKILIKNFLPGPLTIALKPKKRFPKLLMNKNGKVGVRIIPLKLINVLIEKFGKPITATSANLSGKEQPEDPRKLEINADLLLFAGKVKSKIPSIVIEVEETAVIIHRVGKIPLREIRTTLKKFCKGFKIKVIASR